MKFDKELLKVSGEVSQVELEMILDYLPKNEEAVIVELGSLYGRTCSIMAKYSKGTVFAVENFCINNKDTKPYFTQHVLEKYTNIVLCEGNTHDIAPIFDKTIDFLFIDADHQDHSIKEDCEDWLPKVKSGGIVAFHDYFNNMFPSVQKRVDEATVSWKVLNSVERLIIKEKP